MPEIRTMVRYCVKGHEIQYKEGGIIRSRCPLCGSPVDRDRPPITLEEAQKIKEQQAAHEAELQAAREAELRAAQEAERKAAEADPTHAEETERRSAGGAGVLPGQRPAERPAGGAGVLPGQRPAGGAGVLPGQRPAGGAGVLPGQRPTGGAGVLPGQRPAGGAGVLPGQRPAGGAGVLPGQRPAGGAGPTFFLNLYGDRIPIPEEGAWIGREGLGSRWFDGNLMISRKHVYVRPNPQTQRLQVNEDKSLNGVFYSGPGGERIRLEGARMMQPGEVLWIYNIPLRIEQ